MTSAILYGTTSDNELRPVRVTDSGEFVTDGGGGGDWYANLYVGGTEGDSSISLLSDGSISANGDVTALAFITDPDGGGVESYRSIGGAIQVWRSGLDSDSITCTISAAGDINCRKCIPADGYDVSKIGQALSTIHDVIESVDDLQGLKNLFHLLLDNLKTDPTPPTEPTS